MLNKQGLFSRGNQSGQQSVNGQPGNTQSGNSSSISSLSSRSRSDDQFIMPGHLAAIESAHSTSPAIPSVALSVADKVEAKQVEPKQVADIKTDIDKSSSGSRLIVGPDVKLKGAEIQDCDTLVVEGRVEATMDSRVIQIAEKGAFSGKVGIDVAEIYGKFDGELTARGQLIIHATGRVSGKIRYGKIYIEEGGELSGDIASINADTVKSSHSSLRSSNVSSA